jgi:acyl carrier protein
MRDLVLAAGDVEGKRLIAESVGRHVRRVLRLRDEPIPTGVTLRALGLDSLMAMELRNRIHSDFQVDISASRFFMIRGLDELATMVLNQMVALAPAHNPTRVLDEMEVDSI